MANNGEPRGVPPVRPRETNRRRQTAEGDQQGHQSEGKGPNRARRTPGKQSTPTGGAPNQPRSRGPLCFLFLRNQNLLGAFNKSMRAPQHTKGYSRERTSSRGRREEQPQDREQNIIYLLAGYHFPPGVQKDHASITAASAEAGRCSIPINTINSEGTNPTSQQMRFLLQGSIPYPKLHSSSSNRGGYI